MASVIRGASAPMLKSLSSTTTHTVRKTAVRAFLKTDLGAYATADEIAQVIRDLEDLYEIMISTGLSQEEIMVNDLRSEFLSMIAASRIVKIETHCVYTRGEVRKNIPEMQGVYFLEMDARPDQIKIGKTHDLYDRTKTIWHALSDLKPVFTLRAFLYTENIDRAEKLIHFHFDHFRLDGEWFEKEPIMQWLEANYHG